MTARRQAQLSQLSQLSQLYQLYQNHSAEDLLASLEVAVRIGRRDHQQVIQQLIDGGE